MAYFSNGTEGMQYEARWCNQCVHTPTDDPPRDCPVLYLHALWNYEQHGENDEATTKRVALDALVPMEPVEMPNGITVEFPGKCRMFYEVPR